MKVLILIFTITLFPIYSINAQKNIPPTDTLFITGKTDNPTAFSLDDLNAFPKTAISDQIVYNRNGEIKDTLTGMSGVPIKELLRSIRFTYDDKKNLNEFYFVFIASDGYKVVFSWNEIYNSDAGNHFFIITEMKGKKLNDLDQRIIFFSTADIRTGRRYIKGLQKIDIRQIE